MPSRDHPLLPIAATFAAIGLLSLMDAFMKSASIAVGAYSALLVRALIGVGLAGPAWRLTGGRWPQPRVLRLHAIRGVVVAGMAFTFFFSLVSLPLAQAIAISFIAPLIALWLAALVLGERIGQRAIFAAVLGLAGVVVILGSKIFGEAMGDGAALGIVAVLASAVLYAWNLILQRQQALVAQPLEVGTFQNAVVFLVLLGFAPFVFVAPTASAMVDIAISAELSTVGAVTLSWAYGRAEAQVLVPIEYSGFLWAVVFGWLFFREAVTPGTVIGAVLIVIGCWIAARRERPAPTEQAVL
ncbi:MAG: DMT family transporter [Tsuneonella sp.]